MTFTVLRQHFGDRFYHRGEVREADRRDVQHLIDAGVLVDTKAAPRLQNKAEPPLANKSRPNARKAGPAKGGS